VEEEIFKNHDREVNSTVVGALVTDKLRRVDQVAYVRFASVYREFKTLEELVDEAKAVMDARRFEDPDQGRLFIDPATKSNGNGTQEGEPQPPIRRKSKRSNVKASSSEDASAD